MSDELINYLLYTGAIYGIFILLITPAHHSKLLSQKSSDYMKYARGQSSGGIGMVIRNGKLANSVGAGQCNNIMRQLENLSNEDLSILSFKKAFSSATHLQVICSICYLFYLAFA